MPKRARKKHRKKTSQKLILASILAPKTLPKWSQNRLPNQIFGYFFAILFSTAFLDRFFIDFWSPRGLPKSSQNREKSKKSDEKSMSKKHMVFNTFFSRFFMVLAPESDSKIEICSILFRKRRFCKNRAPVEAKLLFFRFRASQKPLKIDAETHSKKTSKKNLPKIDFGLHFGLPKPPEIDPTSKKIEKKAFEKKLEKKKLREPPTRAGNQRKASLLGPRRTIQPSFQ